VSAIDPVGTAPEMVKPCRKMRDMLAGAISTNLVADAVGGTGMARQA